MEKTDLPEKTDDELISEYNAGRTEAFKELIEKYQDSIYGFVYRMTQSPHEAEDIAQETFVKIWRALARYRAGSGTFKSWIFAVARNTAIDKLRKKRVPLFSEFETADGTNPIMDTLSDPELLPDMLIEKAEERGLLEEGLFTLPPGDREILTLHYSESMTFEAIGKILKKPLNTVKSRHRRAVAKLRDYFEGKLSG